MEGKFIAIVDSLWHPRWDVRDTLAAKGLYVWDMRSWDSGNGNSLETVVIINYEGSVVVNFEITDYDYDYEQGNKKEIFDMGAWLKKHPEVEIRHFDSQIEEKVNTILAEAGLKDKGGK